MRDAAPDDDRYTGMPVCCDAAPADAGHALDAGDGGASLSPDSGVSEAGDAGPEGGDSGAVPRCSDPDRGARTDARAVVSVDCGFAEAGCADAIDSAIRFSGAFTLVAEARLDTRPLDYAVVLSRWNLSDEDRAFEFGLDVTQLPYVLLSEDGTAATITELRGSRQVRLGETYELAVVYSPGERLALFVDGVLVREAATVPAAVHGGTGDLSLGGRPPSGADALAGAIGRVRLYDDALTDQELGDLAASHGRCVGPTKLAPVRRITSGPRFHWFGYYDKYEFDPSDRYVLGMAVEFEGRPPTADDMIEIGMVDLEDGDRWLPLGASRAWNWQQGCMLQWIPGSDDEVIWNDREGEGADARFVARILNVHTMQQRTIDHPIYTLAPDGKTALSVDFHRLGVMRPGYGYEGVADPNGDINAPEDAGIYRVDLTTGDSSLLVSYAEVVAIPHSGGSLTDAKHWFNHALVNDSGSRFFFFHRWRRGNSGFATRVMTANVDDGRDLFVLSEAGGLSHYDWMDDENILIYTSASDGYDLYQDGVGYTRTLFKYPHNGHQTFLPGAEWLVSDTYPDSDRLQRPFLYHLETDEIYLLGHYLSPEAYRGSVRSDTHPRLSRDGRKVVIDSPHEGGRQMYLIGVGDVLDSVSVDR